MVSTTTLAAARSTAAALLGRTDGLSPSDGTVYEASLTIDSDADAPDVKLLQPNQRHRALVRLGAADAEDSAIRSVWLKFPDLYGPGGDQDFLLVSSGDGAPLHHVTLPVAASDPALYSSLWLYLAGLTPVLFGLRTEAGGLQPGQTATFSISPPVGKFRRVGALTVTDEEYDGAGLDFAARHSGGNIRPLPPVNFY